MKKAIRVLTALCLVLTMILTMSGCSVEKQAEAAVNNFMSALKKADLAGLKSSALISEDAAKESLDELDVFGEDFDYKELLGTLFEKLDYKILSSEKADENTVNVEVEITTKDMKPVMQKFMQDAISYALQNAFSGGNVSEEEQTAKMLEMFISAVEESEEELLTTKVTVPVKKDGVSWKVDVTETVGDALLGGLMTATKDLENMF